MATTPSPSDAELREEIVNAFDIRKLQRPGAARLERLMAEVRGGRPLDSIHDGLDQFILNQAAHRVANANYQRQKATWNA